MTRRSEPIWGLAREVLEGLPAVVRSVITEYLEGHTTERDLPLQASRGAGAGKRKGSVAIVRKNAGSSLQFPDLVGSVSVDDGWLPSPSWGPRLLFGLSHRDFRAHPPASSYS
jgi:hypothetical protein